MTGTEVTTASPWCWFAVLDARPTDPTLASAEARELDGTPFGVLAAWPAGRKPVRHAVRMSTALVDRTGPPTWLSLLLLPRDRSPLFDDPAISGAMRAVLVGPRLDGVSTLVRDSSHFAGSVTIRRDSPARLVDDPLARLGPARRLRVAAGLFGIVPPVPGPVIQRYAGQPWPVAGF